MSIVDGFGTFYYGYDDARDDGSFVTARYVVAAMLPIVPRGTERVRFRGLHDSLLRGHAEYELVEHLPLRWNQIGRTYVRCWLLVPRLLFAPMLGLVGVAGVLHVVWGRETTSTVMSAVTPGFAVVVAGYVIGMLWYLIRRARRVGLRGARSGIRLRALAEARRTACIESQHPHSTYHESPYCRSGRQPDSGCPDKAAFA